VLAQVRRDQPGGVVLIADSLDPQLVSLFGGASTYNITGQTQHKSPPEIRAWAHTAYPKMVAAAGLGKISTVTVIPGYDDRNTGRPPPRPVTDRWDGETYRVLWQEAVAAAPDYVLITSWNEWYEGSESSHRPSTAPACSIRPWRSRANLLPARGNRQQRGHPTHKGHLGEYDSRHIIQSGGVA